MCFDNEQGISALVAATDRQAQAIHEQTVAITAALNANRPKPDDDDMKITLTAKRILDDDVDGKLTQQTFADSLSIGRSTIFDPRTDINKRLKRMFELHQANGYSAKRGFVTSIGIEGEADGNTF